jgi:hypothetical protein
MIRQFILCCLILCSFLAIAQDKNCGMNQEQLAQTHVQLLKNIETLAKLKGIESTRTNEIIYIPITFHLIAKTNGTGRASSVEVLRTLCKINDSFDPVGIQFYWKQFKYMDNDIAYAEAASGPGLNLLQDQKDLTSLNIYIANDAGDGTGGGNVLGVYYQGSDYDLDFIIIRKQNFTIGESETPTHELGHFFSLNHTFYGWECGPFCGPGNAPATSSCGAIPTEKANGSNCASSGDFICDTQADYEFGFGCTNCPSTFAPLAKDPTGATLTPFASPYNFMSYYIGCSEYIFSQTQMDLMNVDANGSHRNYCTPAYVPNQTAVTGTPVLTSPANNAVIPYNQIFFQWNAVSGATHYFIEIDISSSFNVLPIRVIAQTNSILITDLLQSNKTYKWRIYPFNEYNTCAAPSTNSSFTTNTQTEVNDMSDIATWVVKPNPIVAGQALQMDVFVEMPLEGVVNLMGINGQLVHRQEVNLIAGENNLSLSTAGLAPGHYTVVLQTPEGAMRQQVIVVE